jgi:membrane-bound metal-dependent hydrolase YbcI (DUF457 family)
MFAGHYGVSFACKGVEQRLPLWLLFLAVQFVDILWCILILLGIEKVRIVPGITATNPFDLYYMPYTHSLVAAVVWSALVFLGYRMFFSRRSASRDRLALFLALAVFSHWILDLLVHRPDLPLYDNTHKLGLGLWNYPMPTFALEAAILFGGIWIYMRSTRGGSLFGKYAMPVFGIVLLVVHWILFFGAPPGSANAAAVLLLVLYLGFAAIAAYLERKRQVRAL